MTVAPLDAFGTPGAGVAGDGVAGDGVAGDGVAGPAGQADPPGADPAVETAAATCASSARTQPGRPGAGWPDGVLGPLPRPLPRGPLRVTAYAIPDSEPPYDAGPEHDEPATGGGRRLPPYPMPPPEPAPAQDAPSALRLVPAPDEPDEQETSFDPVRTPRTELEDPLPRAAMLTRAVLEAVSGLRPVTQLSRWLSADVLAIVQSMVANRSARPSPTALRRVLVCEPLPGIAEVTAIVDRGARVEALALRLEGLDGRWLVTALQRA